MADKFDSFPRRPAVDPKIYVYKVNDRSYDGLVKIGYTTGEVEKRVKQQFNIKDAGKALYTILDSFSAVREDGSVFLDKDIHRHLRKLGIDNPNNSEWFRCDLETLRSAVIAVRLRKENIELRSADFSLRPEQRAAVDRTKQYFAKTFYERPDKTPHFLWNAKMRFGKTFATYQLAREMGWTRILVLTFKPAVQSAWEEDIRCHIDFEGWHFLSGREFEKIKTIGRNVPLVCFGSFQDLLGKNDLGGIKLKNEAIHAITWDCTVLDEYHFGAWRESAKDLFEGEERAEIKLAGLDAQELYEEESMPITTRSYLYLSGTPFRAIARGEFIEEQIFNWTYSDEQRAKQTWAGDNNPYMALPRMVMLTYQIPEEVQRIALKGQFNEFDLNIFFSAEGQKDQARFKYEIEVQRWIDLIRGHYTEDSVKELRYGANRAAWPFSHADFLHILSHTLWFLPNVSSCYAMRNLLKKKQNTFFSSYDVIVAAGDEAGLGVEALAPVKAAMRNPLITRTITLSCGKLMTGVSVPPWSGIFMLRSTSSPETYFQAAFRVQTPWSIRDPENPSQAVVLKDECYVFDFAPVRALRQISDYSCRLNIEETGPEEKVRRFIEFLPVLAFDGGVMKRIDAAGVLDIAMSGTTATLLARKWEDSNLVNLDLVTLQRLLDNPAAIDALMQIEGFRNINKDIEVIINKTKGIQKAKKEANDRKFTDEEKEELNKEDKERKNLRKQIQDKLIKFITRIPIFMYLTDYREETLFDVISELEPELFKKVTGLTKAEFQLLNQLGLFNSDLMDDAVYKFKRYEDSSLSYAGISKTTEKIGLWSKVVQRSEQR